jgi:3-phenylpropionate/trans-cinnamate dioxygenase ferredoxin subunit
VKAIFAEDETPERWKHVLRGEPRGPARHEELIRARATKRPTGRALANRTNQEEEEGLMPKFMKAATTDEVEDQQAKLVEVEGQKIALFRVGEAFYALSDTCTHRGGPLSEGTVEGAEVTCPWHGAKFDIKTGAVLGPPAGREVRSYPVRVAGADVEIEV